MQQQWKYCCPGHPLLAKGSLFCKWTSCFNVLKASRELSRKLKKIKNPVTSWHWSMMLGGETNVMWGRRRMLLSYLPKCAKKRALSHWAESQWDKKRRKKKGAMSRLQHGRTHHCEGEECVGSDATRGLHVRERVCDTTQSSMEAYADGATCTETPRIVSTCCPYAGALPLSDNLWIALLNKRVVYIP